MNQNEPIDPASLPDTSAIHERVTAIVRSHQRKLRLLTGAAFFLGFLSVAASIVIVSTYFVSYRPKEKQLLREVTLAAQEAKTNPAAAQGSAGDSPRLKFDYPSVQATMTYVHSLAITFMAVALGLLALGTLVLLAVVILSRRATLSQINASLAQISRQLGELRPPPGRP
jgi:cytochrome c biogenesis protein CcdA